MPVAGLVIGFDYGTRFIGVAVAQRLTGSARPLPHLTARDGVPEWQEIEALLTDWRPECAIVGLPLNMDGSESEMSRRARKFANRLHGRFGVQVCCLDERLSSAEARTRLMRRQDQCRGGELDSMAAAIILEHWLNEQDQQFPR